MVVVRPCGIEGVAPAVTGTYRARVEIVVIRGYCVETVVIVGPDDSVPNRDGQVIRVVLAIID